MKIQASISAEINRSRIGTISDVLIEGRSEDKPFPFIGRTMGQAPDIDGVTFVQTRKALAGEMLSCRIVSTGVYDLFAKRISGKP